MLFPQSKIGNLKSKMSFYDPIRSRQHIRRNCQADLFCRFTVEHKCKLHRVLHRQISRFGTFKILST